ATFSVVVGRVPDESVLVGVAGCFGAVGDVEFAGDVGEVELDGLFGDTQFFADGLVGEAFGDGFQDDDFAFGEAGGFGGCVFGLFGQAERVVDGAFDGLADGGGEVLWVDALDDVAACAFAQGELDLLGFAEDAEDDDFGVGVAFADQLEAGQAVHFRHADVEQDDVGVGSADQWQHLAPR